MKSHIDIKNETELGGMTCPNVLSFEKKKEQGQNRRETKLHLCKEKKNKCVYF